MDLYIDFETRSEIDLIEQGIHVYASHITTNILCMAIKVNDSDTCLFIPPQYENLWTEKSPEVKQMAYDDVCYYIKECDQIHAHNAEFERLMWKNKAQKDLDFPLIPLNKWRCTAAKAAVHALPRGLDKASQALGLSEFKDMTGHMLMKKWCKPRKSTKSNKALWHDSVEEYVAICKYCVQDVNVEYLIDKALSDINPHEQAVWQQDQIINDRGMMVDIEAIDGLMDKIAEKKVKLLEEYNRITDLKSPNQIQQTIKWIESRGIDIPDLTAKTVELILRTELPDKVRRVLEIRQAMSKSSVSKFPAMRNRASEDGRVRGAFLYHAAATGRWGGKGIQPQNYPRSTFGSNKIQDILSKSILDIDKEYGCTIEAASKCLRGMITTEKDKTFYCVDYTGIEARLVAWFVHEKHILESIIRNEDPYIKAAMVIYKKPYDEITKKERYVGKIATLACGYQGSTGAYRKLGGEEIDSFSDSELLSIIYAWREDRPETVNAWYTIDRIVRNVINTKKSESYRSIKYGIRKNFLHCRLPSGRLLSYYKPNIGDFYDKKQDIMQNNVISFESPMGKRAIYGGMFMQNVIQAIARDILAGALIRLKHWNVVAHIHDEILVEEPDLSLYYDNPEERSEKVLNQIIKTMVILPDWAKGLPLAAEGWIGKRYRK